MVRTTYYLDFSFADPAKRGAIGPPSASIFVKVFGGKEGGRPEISPDCVNYYEFEIEVEKLTRELQKIKEAAKRKFKATGDPTAGGTKEQRQARSVRRCAVRNERPRRQ